MIERMKRPVQERDRQALEAAIALEAAHLKPLWNLGVGILSVAAVLLLPVLLLDRLQFLMPILLVGSTAGMIPLLKLNSIQTNYRTRWSQLRHAWDGGEVHGLRVQATAAVLVEGNSAEMPDVRAILWDVGEGQTFYLDGAGFYLPKMMPEKAWRSFEVIVVFGGSEGVMVLEVRPTGGEVGDCRRFTRAEADPPGSSGDLIPMTLDELLQPDAEERYEELDLERKLVRNLLYELEDDFFGYDDAEPNE